MSTAWIPLGYMLKRVRSVPDWLPANEVADICAVSGCISEPFTEYTPYWRHNGFWLFDGPAALDALARSAGVDQAEQTLFYYEAWPEEFDEPSRAWRAIATPDLPVQVQPPLRPRLLGFDVVTWSTGAGPECSPLSCNRLAAELKVNAHCLFDRHQDALEALSAGRFNNTEPGPFRVVAVYRTPP